jgi:tetratricopeptide (TPR) repeat protein
MSRKNLVDGSAAYKERKFDQAEELFRRAAARDPEGKTVEGRTALLFLARTLHSEYIGNRQRPELAQEAIDAYKKSLAVDKNDQSSYKAIASLYENLQKPDEWQKWVTDRATNSDPEIKPQYKAEALTSLAAKQNTCANEITDTEQTKKTVKIDGKDAYQFVKPANPEDLTKLQQCVAEGNRLIEQAVSLEPDTVKNAKSLNPGTMTDQQLKESQDVIKPFESARSYHASLLLQAMRLAEMEGRDADRDKLKAQADDAKASFLELSEVGKKIQNEIDARKAAAEEAANANANKK